MGEVDKSLGKLAEEINAEHRACEAALRSGLRHAVRAGELLTEAKGQVKHGEWGTWLSANFVLTEFYEVQARSAKFATRSQRPTNAENSPSW
jgi:predicted transcriptional regulator